MLSDDLDLEIQHTGLDENGFEEKQCRICLDEEDPEDMIAPCRCRGTSKWVHRSCLDQWRAAREDRAFSRCTECLYEYQMIVVSEPDERRWRKTKFCMLVSRDFCVVFILVQVIIGLLGWFLRAVDGGFFLGLFSDNCQYSDRWAHTGAFWCHHTLSAYYIWGFLMFLVILGLVGLSIFCVNGCSIPDYARLEEENQQHHHYPRGHCCDGCEPCYCYYYGGDCGNCAGCACCDCGADCGAVADCGGECAVIMVIILIIIAIVLAITGLFIGIILTVMLIQHVVQRHMKVLQKRELTKEYIVIDLSQEEIIDLQDDRRALMSVDLDHGLSEMDVEHLQSLGLMD